MYAEVFKDDKGEWRWHVSSKGKLVAASGEGYEHKQHAKLMVDELIRLAHSDLVIQLIEE